MGLFVCVYLGIRFREHEHVLISIDEISTSRFRPLLTDNCTLIYLFNPM